MDEAQRRRADQTTEQESLGVASDAASIYNAAHAEQPALGRMSIQPALNEAQLVL